MSSYTKLPLRRHAIRVRAAFARFGANASLFALVMLAACGGGGDKGVTEPAVPPPVVPPVSPDPGTPLTGIVSVTPSGLPAGVSGRVTLRSGNSTHLLVGASSVAGLAPGTWSVTADIVTDNGVTFVPSPATQTVTVTAAATTNVAVSYIPNSGTMAIAVSGLPPSASGDITVTGPGGFRRTAGGSVSLSALEPGTYHIEAKGVRLASGSFAPTIAQQDVDIVASATPFAVAVTYVVAPSIINVNVAGLPGGSNATITLTPPSGAPIAVTGSTRLPAALAGRWQMSAGVVHYGGSTWTPSPAAKDTSVASGDSLEFNVQYTLTTGAIAVLVTGLPNGVNGLVRVTGPGNFLRTITATTTITDVAPGVYTVTADELLAGGITYRTIAPAQQVTVTASLTAAGATVNYAAAIAKLTVGVSGTPVGATNMIQVTGPAGFDRFISGTTTFNNISPGTYTIVSNPIVLPGGVRYEGSPPSIQRTLAFGGTDSVGITYTRGGGRVAVTVTGLPSGANAAIVLSGNSTAYSITATETVENVAPGNYTLSASPVTFNGTTYNPSPVSSALVVATSVTTSSTVAYAAVVVPVSPGHIVITVLGLPVGANAAMTLVGPSTNLSVTSSVTLDVAPGSYTLSAAPTSYATITYNPTQASIPLVVVANGTMNASVTYTAAPVSGGGMNLILDGFYLTQAVQKMDGSVPLVAGRDALLRVFVHASQANTDQPSVRVRVYDGTTLLQTLTLTAPEGSVRTTLAEGTLSSSWNSVITGANVRNALRVVADVDPTGTIAESDESDNGWPRSGVPQSFTVNTVPTFNIRFVPVTVGALTGNVTTANKDNFLVSTRRMHPVNDVVSDVRAPFTSSATVLQSGDANGAWTTVLSELNALRTADGAPASMHYYGVLKVGYSSGIAGYGYVPGKAAIGWDYLPSGDEVAAHELGHNFGRPHTNCGGAGNPDVSYPYAGGTIGVYGWNSGTGGIVPPTATDVMGYCSNQWTSDWTWSRVMSYRGIVPDIRSASISSATQEGLLVWGRVVNGRVILEPAFRVNARPSPIAMSGSHRLQALDARGGTLLDIPLDAERVDHILNRDERHFAVVVPWSARLERALATLRVSDVRQPLSGASISSAATAAAFAAAPVDSVPVLMPVTSARVLADGLTRKRVEWDATAYPMVMARDARTGEIMAFLRQSGDGMVTGGRNVELVFSDGVRSRVMKP